MLLRAAFVLLSLATGMRAATADIVELKDGGQRRGHIVGRKPGQSLTLESADGSRFVIPESQVAKISKAPAPEAEPEALYPRRPASRRKKEPQVPIEDLGHALLELRGAWGLPTKLENDINAAGYTIQVQAFDIGLRSGYEWEYIGVSLGFDYNRRTWLQSGSSQLSMPYSRDGQSQGIFSVPLMVGFFAPFGWFKPGLKLGGSISFYDGYGGGSSINAVIEPVLKFLVSKNFDLSFDLRYILPTDNGYSNYGTDKTTNARTSLGTSLGLRI